MAALKGVSDWEAMWTEADKDGSGFLSLVELRDLLNKNGSHVNDKEIAQMFMNIHTHTHEDKRQGILELTKGNSDEKIDKERFIVAMKHLQGCLHKAEQLFDKFDKDGSGFLEKREVMEVCKAAYGLSDREAREKAEALIDQSDRDYDGRMSKAELMNALA